MVSSATLTAIRMEEAPKGLLTFCHTESAEGMVDRMARNSAAKSVRREDVRARY